MERARRGRVPKVGLLLVALALTLPTVPANGPQNDAGSGGDAGDTRLRATSIGVGSWSGSFNPYDADWYAHNATSSGPACYEYGLTADVSTSTRLEIETQGGLRYLSASQAANVPSRLAMAVQAPTARVLPSVSTPGGPGIYSFSLASLQAPASQGSDALSGRDASSALNNAVPVAQGCFGGRLAGLSIGDTADAYAVTLAAGEQLAYSFAVEGGASSLTLALLDATGRAVGPVLAAGSVGIVDVPQGGTYFLVAASSSSSLGDTGYVVGAVTGPPDPGNPCRPTC